MRELTFASFLKTYLRQLSGEETASLAKLVTAASKEARLKEPLFVYALCSGKEEQLLRILPHGEWHEQFRELLANYNKCTLELALQFDAEDLPEPYKKLYRSYQSRKNRVQNDNHTKYLMRERILRLQEAKGLSNYRIYTDLKLNQGNVNAFLKHGDCSKISLPIVRQMLSYIEQTEGKCTLQK